MHDPKRFAVGVPLAVLRAEVAARSLAERKKIEGTASAMMRAECDQRVENERGIAIPETFVSVRAGKNFARRVQDQRCDSLIIQSLEKWIGNLEVAATGEFFFPRCI